MELEMEMVKKDFSEEDGEINRGVKEEAYGVRGKA